MPAPVGDTIALAEDVFVTTLLFATFVLDSDAMAFSVHDAVTCVSLALFVAVLLLAACRSFTLPVLQGVRRAVEFVKYLPQAAFVITESHCEAVYESLLPGMGDTVAILGYVLGAPFFLASAVAGVDAKLANVGHAISLLLSSSGAT